MANQYLKGLRAALICATLAAVVLVPCTGALAQESVDDRGAGQIRLNDGTASDDVSNVKHPRLYPRANYVWPYGEGPYYGDVSPLAIAEGVPGVVVTEVGSFHLAQGALPIPEELRTTNRLGELGAQYFIVSMSGELDLIQDAIAKIEANGGTVVDQLGNGSMVARLTVPAYATISDAVGMMAIEPYHPALKITPHIGREPLPDPIKAMSEVYDLDVMLWPGESGEAVAGLIAKLGANVTGVMGDQIRVEAHRSLLPRIAALEPVKTIYEALPVYAHAEETTTTMQTGQYNQGAVPYHAAGVMGGGGNFGVCTTGGAVCNISSPPGGCGTCAPRPQILMVLDSGIQLDAGDLSHTATAVGTVGATHRKVLAYESTQQFSGVGDLLGCDAPAQGGFTHGHTVSTTALGNATNVPVGYGAAWNAQDQQGNPWKLDGLAPRAKLIAYDGQITPPTVSCADPLQDTISPGDLWNPATPNISSLGKAYIGGARIVNFSWGTTANTYNTNSGDIDAFLVARPDAMVFVSAGNEGQDVDVDGEPDPLTVGAPSTAKNSLSIGASRNADTTNQPESREAFSSVGPSVNATSVNRINPQLMAPGGEAGAGALGIPSEFSCRSNDNNQTAPVACDTIQGVEGTSFSAPAAAGAGLLVRDYFFQGFYPNRVAATATSVPTISGALVKAALIASADFMGGANLTKAFRWNNQQGMGRIQLDNVLPLENWPASPTGLIVHDTLAGVINVSNLSLPATVSSGNSHTATFKVCNDQEEIRIALAYTDIQNQALRNNLNLQVTSPSGKVYRGNYFSDDNNRNGVADAIPGEDCPPIGFSTPNGVIDQGQWSLPTCGNSAIPGFSDLPVPFDQTNVIEGIFLSPDADNNCNPGTNPPPACYHEGTCTQGGNLAGVGGGRCGNALDCSTDPVGLSDNPICLGGTKQPEIGTWQITVSAGTPFTPQAQDYAIVIAGGVCVGSTVKFDRGFYTCNKGASVQVTELAEAFDTGCNAGSCPISTIQNRTTVRAFNENDVEVDCEGPDCSMNPTAGLIFTQPSPQALIFTSKAVNLTDGTVPQPGNGTLDIRDGYTIEALYEDVNAALQPLNRRSTATVGCQVAIGFGAVQVPQFGQDQSILVQGGCERAEERIGESQGFFEYGFPDRYMDADELIQFNFAFNSDETEDLDNVEAALRCVSIDADSPAECLPNGAGCEVAECGGQCDPRRANNPSCPYLSVLDSPKFIGRLPANAAISANFAIQMQSESTFGSLTPTVEMLLEVSADVAGKTASGLAVSRQRLNIDTTETLFNTDYPTGGVGIVFDYNSNEAQENPITDLAGFQALDYRFETRSYGNLKTGFNEAGAVVPRNTNIQSPWNFDGGSNGFTNGLASITDEASAQGSLIFNWGEDKNFNGIQDGTCAANSGIACYAFPTDPRCPPPGTCTSIENNAADSFFTQNRNNRGGCGWQTRPPHICTNDSTRGCFTTADCAGTCQQTSNSILSTFAACGSGFPSCPSVKQCSAASPTPLAACATDANCGGAPGSCQTVPQACVADGGTCNLGSTATRGGIWHTGRIGDQGVGACDGTQSSQCGNYKVITTTANTLIWWDLLLTPRMEKTDQSIIDGLPNSRIEISYWAWNQATNLRDNNVAYSWEFDTDTETLFPVDLIGDGTALNFAVGDYGTVAAANNPDLTNGFSMFAPMGRCSGGDGACRRTTECPAGACSLNNTISCHVDSECSTVSAGICNGEETCTQLSSTFNGTDGQGNNRVGKNSCFFEGVGTIPPAAFAEIGTSLPRDDDFDNDSDTLIDEFVTAAGPIRNHDVVAFNGPDMRFGTLEDIFGDTGNSFQGSLGIVNFEGSPENSAQQSYGVGLDDMYVEWKEFTLDPDQTSCNGGSCAIMELPTTNLFQGNNVIGVSLLESTPYNSACVGGPNAGQACFTSNPVCPSGACLPTFNDCDLNGLFNSPGDDTDCNNNGTPDVVARATSEADVSGVILYLDKQGTTDEYRADLSVSLTAESAGTLFLSQNGVDSPTIVVTYLDLEDGTGHKCQNSVVPEQQGLILAVTTAFIPDCDLQLASSSITDNGDGDFFADTNETVTIDFSVRNNCGLDLTGCSARLSTNSPHIQCILTTTVPLGTVPFNEQGTPFPSPQDFRFKVSSAADRQALGLTPNSVLDAEFTVSFTCNEIDANSFPQSLSYQLDLNLSDLGQVPAQWKEDFESATLGKFSGQNLDAGIPGNNNIDGLTNGDGWRCAYSNPDWVNGSSYGSDVALDCFPGQNLAHSNTLFWKIDGSTAPHTGEKRAYRGAHAMYYGVFLTNPAGEFSTPMAAIEASRTTAPLNLGVGFPELSFWHQISLVDHRNVGPLAPFRSADRGVVQIQLADNAGNPISDWTNLQPIQNAYDEQATDNFFNCLFDPVDDGSQEDDFFDPTDPNRDDGPSSTCFPEFTFGFHGDTNDPFNPTNIGNSTTPPVASDSPALGPGTWVETVVDLSEFRGRRARLRFLMTALKAQGENWELQFPGFNPGDGDDGWWIDDVIVNQTLTNPAQIVNDQFNLRTCSINGNACIAQCSLSFTACSPTVACGVGQGTCVAPCPSGQTCSGPAPSCGAACSTVTANVFAETATENLLNPATIQTAAPGQVVAFNAADPGTPSTANSCLSGVLQYQFCISADADGVGGNPPDADCNNIDQNPNTPDDEILRGWTENATLSVAPQASGSYVVEVRCSTTTNCMSSRKIDVVVQCPGGVNALGLSNVRATKSGSVVTLVWTGALAVDTWTSNAYGVINTVPNPDEGGMSLFFGYPGTTTNSLAVVSSKLMSEAVNPGQFRGYLIKANGAINHQNVGLGYFCNSRTWREGDAAEIDEVNPVVNPFFPDPYPPARDETLGNP